MPMVLAQWFAEPGDQSAGLRHVLVEFGRTSGLFSDVTINRLGTESDPFQILVMTGDRHAISSTWATESGRFCLSWSLSPEPA